MGEVSWEKAKEKTTAEKSSSLAGQCWSREHIQSPEYIFNLNVNTEQIEPNQFIQRAVKGRSP